MVLQPVDHGHPRLVGVEPVEDLAGAVDRVDALPRPRCVRALAPDGHVDAHRTLAAGLDDGVRGFHQDREVGRQQVRAALREDPEAVVLLLDLLGLVEQEGDVAVGRRHGRGDLEHHRDPALHVAGAQTMKPSVQQVAFELCRQVRVDRHGVEVAGDDHPLRQPQGGPRDDGVAVTRHGQVCQRPQRRLYRVGDLLLVAADRLDVHQLLEERDGVAGQVQIHAGHLGRGPELRRAGAR